MPFDPPRLSKSKALADAVGKYCESTFVLPFRSKLGWSFNQRELKEREFVVWPNDRDVSFSTRNSMSVDYTIALAVVERLGSMDPEDTTTDSLLAAVEAIGDNLLGVPLLDAVCVGYTHLPLYDRELLEQQRIFAGGIALRFVRREVLSHL